MSARPKTPEEARAAVEVARQQLAKAERRLESKLNQQAKAEARKSAAVRRTEHQALVGSCFIGKGDDWTSYARISHVPRNGDLTVAVVHVHRRDDAIMFEEVVYKSRKALVADGYRRSSEKVFLEQAERALKHVRAAMDLPEVRKSQKAAREEQKEKARAASRDRAERLREYEEQQRRAHWIIEANYFGTNRSKLTLFGRHFRQVFVESDMRGSTESPLQIGKAPVFIRAFESFRRVLPPSLVYIETRREFFELAGKIRRFMRHGGKLDIDGEVQPDPELQWENAHRVPPPPQLPVESFELPANRLPKE